MVLSRSTGVEERQSQPALTAYCTTQQIATANSTSVFISQPAAQRIQAPYRQVTQTTWPARSSRLSQRAGWCDNSPSGWFTSSAAIETWANDQKAVIWAQKNNCPGLSLVITPQQPDGVAQWQVNMFSPSPGCSPFSLVSMPGEVPDPTPGVARVGVLQTCNHEAQTSTSALICLGSPTRWQG